MATNHIKSACFNLSSTYRVRIPKKATNMLSMKHRLTVMENGFFPLWPRSWEFTLQDRQQNPMECTAKMCCGFCFSRQRIVWLLKWICCVSVIFRQCVFKSLWTINNINQNSMTKNVKTHKLCLLKRFHIQVNTSTFPLVIFGYVLIVMQSCWPVGHEIVIWKVVKQMKRILYPIHISWADCKCHSMFILFLSKEIDFR